MSAIVMCLGSFALGFMLAFIICAFSVRDAFNRETLMAEELERIKREHTDGPYI